MTSLLRTVAALFAAALCAACSGPAENAAPPDAQSGAASDAPRADPNADGDVFTLQRGVCFGFCPAYIAQVAADDRLVFIGKSYVAATGERTKRLPTGSFARLVKIAETHDFAALDAAYPNAAGDNCGNMATDMATVDMAFDAAALRHEVHFYQGCFDFAGREGLIEMIAEVDAVLALDDWIGPREDFNGPR